MDPTSVSLLDQLRGPDRAAAWPRFVRLYTPLLLHWAVRQGFQPADAADLVQEVFVKLLSALSEFERQREGSFRAWLRRIVVNQSRDFRRRRATRLFPGDDGLSGYEDDPPADDADDRLRLVRRGLEVVRPDFSDSTWAAFAGVMIDSRPAGNVAAELGISENAVYLARHRVLTRLRQELDGLLD
jgi:RNA polymerase sigma-70 factor (ECF subfamily)